MDESAVVNDSVKQSVTKNKVYQSLIKRFLDFIISLITLIILSPIFVIISIVIKISDGGHIFYKAYRTGKNGKKFRMYKFRTMNDVPEGQEFSMTYEYRVTKIGRFLRKTFIDELPQLINVLKGDMSLIGPRPWIPSYYEHFTEDQKHRCDCLPGITGLAQTSGGNKLTVFEKINYDLVYIKNISIKTDFKIIINTIKMVLKKDHSEIVQEDINKEIDLLKKQKN